MAVTFIERKNFHCGERSVRVRIPIHLSLTGEARWAEKGIDTCIADIIEALTQASIYTNGCCCGHGVSTGNIILSDGRVLEIYFPDDWAAHQDADIK